MSHACTPMAFLVSEILTFKKGQISLSDHGSPLSSKNLIDKSAQKIHAIGIDVECMHTNFSGRALPSFRDN